MMGYSKTTKLFFSNFEFVKLNGYICRQSATAKKAFQMEVLHRYESADIPEQVIAIGQTFLENIRFLH